MFFNPHRHGLNIAEMELAGETSRAQRLESEVSQ
jgi:hypothetical protein